MTGRHYTFPELRTLCEQQGWRVTEASSGYKLFPPGQNAPPLVMKRHHGEASGREYMNVLSSLKRNGLVLPEEKKTMNRITRDQPLTPAEVEAYAAISAQAEAEFPPLPVQQSVVAEFPAATPEADAPPPMDYRNGNILGRRWDTEEDGQLISMRQRGLPFEEIAPLLSRSLDSVRVRHARLNRKPTHQKGAKKTMTTLREATTGLDNSTLLTVATAKAVSTLEELMMELAASLAETRKDVTAIKADLAKQAGASELREAKPDAAIYAKVKKLEESISSLALTFDRKINETQGMVAQAAREAEAKAADANPIAEMKRLLRS